MNREYTDFAYHHSNNGIYEAFYTEIRKPHQSVLYGLRVRFVNLVRAILTLLSSVRARRIARVCSATVALIGVIGVAGALETGKISPVASLFLAAGFLLLTYFSLKPKRRKAPASGRNSAGASVGCDGCDQFGKRRSDADSCVDRL